MSMFIQAIGLCVAMGFLSHASMSRLDNVPLNAIEIVGAVVSAIYLCIALADLVIHLRHK